MLPRINFYKVAPEAIQAMRGLEHYINQSSGLEPSLRELVKTRASQINGCAYCIDMHTKDARAAGETEQRLYALDAWRETRALQIEACQAKVTAPSKGPETKTPEPIRMGVSFPWAVAVLSALVGVAARAVVRSSSS